MVRVPRRGGFTLIESLVVIAIAAILVALLLPAVQKVRGTATRMTCSNHLKQIAFAESGHHAARGYLTPGGTHGASGSVDRSFATPALRETEWSWAYLLLPHLDRRALYENPDPAVVRSTPVKAYHCPARRSAEAVDGLAKIDYAGNAGTSASGVNGAIVRTGFGTVNFDAIIDGTASTILIAEKRLNRAALGRSSDDDESYCTPGWSGDWEVYRWGDGAPAADFEASGATDPTSAFGSAHTGGLNVAFCDGAVRHIRYGIDATLWQRLCVRNDGLAIRGNSW